MNEYNKPGRPTNTDRINKNREEITSNEESIEKLGRQMTAIAAGFSSIEERIKEIGSQTDRLAHAEKRIKALDEAIGIVASSMNQLTDSADKRIIKNKETCSGDVALLRKEICQVENEHKELRRLLEESVRNGASYYEAAYKGVTKTKSDYEVHSRILIGLGLLVVGLYGYTIWQIFQ